MSLKSIFAITSVGFLTIGCTINQPTPEPQPVPATIKPIVELDSNMLHKSPKVFGDCCKPKVQAQETKVIYKETIPECTQKVAVVHYQTCQSCGSYPVTIRTKSACSTAK